MFYKVSGSFLVWYVLAFLTVTYMDSANANISLVYILAGFSYFVFPLIAGAFIFNSSNK